MKVFGRCIDRRVVAGVVVAAVLSWWLAPGAVATLLPLLALAICPLSMLLMMKAMDRGTVGPAAPRPTVPQVEPRGSEVAAVPEPELADPEPRRS